MTGVEVTTPQLELLRGAAELRILNLTGLVSADAVIDTINSFAALETLNLFGSDLSDAGLATLSVPTVGSLHLGATQVTAPQMLAYQEAHQGLKVYGDVDLEAVRVIEEIDLANSAQFNPQTKK
jgi:hypothetical protein